MQTVLLLVASNIFMTLAWYGHLKFKFLEGKSLLLVIFVSWGIAFFEYCLMVPANRYGYGRFTEGGQTQWYWSGVDRIRAVDPVSGATLPGLGLRKVRDLCGVTTIGLVAIDLVPVYLATLRTARPGLHQQAAGWNFKGVILQNTAKIKLDIANAFLTRAANGLREIANDVPVCRTRTGHRVRRVARGPTVGA